MAYKKNLGAMSSLFGENPNEGNIASENPMKLPPEEKSSMVTPSTIANMFDEAYSGVIEGHNKAQDRLTGSKKPVVEVPKVVVETKSAVEVEKNEPMAQDTKDAIIKNLIGSGMSIKSVFDDCIIAEIDGKEIVISE